MAASSSTELLNNTGARGKGRTSRPRPVAHQTVHCLVFSDAHMTGAPRNGKSTRRRALQPPPKGSHGADSNVLTVLVVRIEDSETCGGVIDKDHNVALDGRGEQVAKQVLKGLTLSIVRGRGRDAARRAM